MAERTNDEFTVPMNPVGMDRTRRSPLDAAALALARPVLLTSAILVTLFAIVNRVADPDHPIVPALDLTVVAASMLVWLGVRHARIHAASAHAITGCLALALASIALLRFALIADSTICALHIIMILIAFGSVSLSRRWLRACTAVILVMWLVVSAGPLSGRDYVEYGLAVISAGVVANLAFEARIRTILVARKAVAERVQAEANGEALRERLEQSRKVEAMGKLAAGLAHDLNNVLQSIAYLAQTVCDDQPVESSSHQDATLIVSEALAAASLTQKLLASGRALVERRDEIDLDRVFDNVVRLLAPVVIPRQTSIVRHSEAFEARVKGDPALLGHALVNLCINASDAMPVGGTIELRTASVALDEVGGAQLGVRPGKYVAIRVADQGSGMDLVTQRRAFEPFFTTKPVGKGTGLGLAMVERAMRCHGGAVTLESELGKGTIVSLYLPIN